MPVSGSSLKIDVAWRIYVKDIDKARSIPNEILIVSIEIQYSDSISSITHGLAKGIYGNSPYHIVISYHPLTEDLKQMLFALKPRGLKLIELV